MTVSVAQLIAAGIGPTQAKLFANPLSATFDRFDIDTPMRRGAFLGQCMVESGLMVHTEENCYYSDPARIASIFSGSFANAAVAAAYAKNPQMLASRVYANRLGNGDEASGEGWLFRGRGLVQITGRTRYQRAGLALGRDYVGHPELVAQPEDASLTAGWYWNENHLNAYADANAIDSITRAVNGPRMLDASLRRQYTQQAIAALR